MLGLHTYVEPIVFFTCACTYTYSTIESEFVYKFVSETYNFTHNDSVYYCNDIQNGTLTASEQAQIVADEVSSWTKIASVLRATANTISVLVITSWSDVIGRRNALLFPVIGALICSSLLLINIYFRISLVLYVVSSVIYGSTGGWSTLINVGTAHLGDTIGKSQRGYRYTLLEIFSALGGGLTQIGTGYWLHQYGFIPPMIFVICCSITALLLTIFLKTIPKQQSIPSTEVAEIVDANATEEQRTVQSVHKVTRCSGIVTQLREVFRIYTRNGIKCETCDDEEIECVHCSKKSKNRVWRLWMYLITYVIYMAAVDGFDLFITMFLVSFPLCFTPNLVGIQWGMSSAIMIFTPLVILLFRSLLRFSIQATLLWGIMGRVATTMFMFFATSPMFVFVGTAFGALSNLTTPFIRVQVSNLVSPTEQGPALALIPSIGKMVHILSPIVILSIYTATLQIRHSFIWAVLALYFVVAFLLMSIVWISDEFYKRRGEKVKV